MLLDELLAGLDLVAHKLGDDTLRQCGIIDGRRAVCDDVHLDQVKQFAERIEYPFGSGFGHLGR